VRKSIGEPKDTDVEKIMSLRLPMMILVARRIGSWSETIPS